MTGELQAFAPWIAILISLLALTYTIQDKRSNRHDARFGAMAEKIDHAEDRISRVEVELRHLPDHDTVNRLESTIEKLHGEVRVLAERVKPISAIADRVQEALLEKAKI